MQDTILFSGSVRDNIAYGTDADLATIEEVARAAGALPFILALPDGFETLLGPGGSASPAVSGASASRGFCCAIPRCWCWTSRPPVWTPRARRW